MVIDEKFNKNLNDLFDKIKIEKIDYELVALSKSPDKVDDVLSKLKIYWKPVKLVLKVAKLITPQKIDKGINEFIAVVDRLCGGATDEEQSQLLDKFAVIWGIVMPILVTAQEITGPKVDAVIDEVLKIGDLLSKS